MHGSQRADFWRFFAGQGLSVLGSSFTAFAMPLLVYQITGSATNLSIAFAAGMMPYLLFGLIGGAYADRSDRKRLMIRTDILRAAVIASVPFLYHLDVLPLWWIYAAGFLTTTLTILFEAAEFAAVPSLVPSGDLVRANGRIQALYSAAFLGGPPLAGLVASFTDVANVLLVDASSFLLSAVLLRWIAASFNTAEERERTSIRFDIAEGLRHVWSHPVLRNISIMMALVNFVLTVTQVQLVLFAKERLGATDLEYGLLLAAGSAGVMTLSLAAGPLRRRFPFGVVALGALAVEGLLIVAFGLTSSLLIALPLWALISGLGILFNINTMSLRQQIVPNHMLGRIMSIASVIAWSANPLGALLGGFLVERIGAVPVYVLAGTLGFLIPIGFAFSPLGHAEDYLPVQAPTAETTLEPVVT